MDRVRRGLAASAALITVSGLLAACSANASSGDTLTWYINPDNGGQAKVAENCSTDDYTIKTQVLPQDASQQRIQLARRLAADDSGIDIMSIDPPYTAEFANAGFLAPIPADLQDKLKDQSFKGAMDAATWDDELVVAPFWSNTQVLWYRKSFVKKAGIDMTKPVTWDQIIDAAAKNGGKVAVQANKYEGYVVWINALISGAGGEIATDTDKGVDLNARGRLPGRREGRRPSSRSSPTPRPRRRTCRSPRRAQAGSTFGGPQGAFMVNWTYIWTNYDATQPEVQEGHRLHPLPADGRRARSPVRRTAASGSGSASTPTTSTRRWRRSSASPARRTRRSTPSSPATCRRARRATRPTATRCRRPTPPTCSSCSRTASTPRRRARSRRTGATSPAASSRPGTRRRASTVTPRPKSQQFIDDVLHGRSLL